MSALIEMDREQYLARLKARLIAARTGEPGPPAPPIAAPTFKQAAPAEPTPPPEPSPAPEPAEAAPDDHRLELAAIVSELATVATRLAEIAKDLAEESHDGG